MTTIDSSSNCLPAGPRGPSRGSSHRACKIWSASSTIDRPFLLPRSRAITRAFSFPRRFPRRSACPGDCGSNTGSRSTRPPRVAAHCSFPASICLCWKVPPPCGSHPARCCSPLPPGLCRDNPWRATRRNRSAPCWDAGLNLRPARSPRRGGSRFKVKAGATCSDRSKVPPTSKIPSISPSSGSVANWASPSSCPWRSPGGMPRSPVACCCWGWVWSSRWWPVASPTAPILSGWRWPCCCWAVACCGGRVDVPRPWSPSRRGCCSGSAGPNAGAVRRGLPACCPTARASRRCPPLSGCLSRHSSGCWPWEARSRGLNPRPSPPRPPEPWAMC